MEFNFAQWDLQASVQGWGWDSEKGFLDLKIQGGDISALVWCAEEVMSTAAAANVNQHLRMAVETWTLDDIIKP